MSFTRVISNWNVQSYHWTLWFNFFSNAVGFVVTLIVTGSLELERRKDSIFMMRGLDNFDHKWLVF
jgi:hypothetical protein